MANEALLTSIRALPAKLQAAQFQFSYPTIEEALPAALR
jgi:NAD dependent epimerase/dehydratase family enzyme